MPNAWQDKFSNASKTTRNSTMLVELQDYMQRQFKKHRSGTSLPNTDSYSQGQPSTTTTTNNNNNRQQQQPPPPRTTTTTNTDNTNSLPCPLPGHAGHTIAQCHQHQHQECYAARVPTTTPTTFNPPSILRSNTQPSKANLSNIPPATAPHCSQQLTPQQSQHNTLPATSTHLYETIPSNSYPTSTEVKCSILLCLFLHISFDSLDYYKLQ
jgi:hypothetical protein